MIGHITKALQMYWGNTMTKKQLHSVVKKSIRGDKVAFDLLCNEKAKLVIFLCIRNMGNQQDGEDAAQEVFIRMQKSINTLRAPEAFEVWLSRLVYTTCNDMRRKNMRSNRLINLDEDTLHRIEDREQPLPGDELMMDVNRRQLIARIDALPEKYRNCVLLHYYQNMDYKSIGKVLNITLNAVNHNLRMARKILRTNIENDRQKGQHGLMAVSALGVDMAIRDSLMVTADQTVTPLVIQKCLSGAGINFVKTVANVASAGLSALQKWIAVVAALVTVVGIGIFMVPRVAPTFSSAFVSLETQNQLNGQIIMDNSRVPDPEAINGIQGITLELVDADNPRNVVQTIHSGSADDPGAFSFSGFPAGDYYVRVQLEPFLYPAESNSELWMEFSNDESAFVLNMDNTPQDEGDAIVWEFDADNLQVNGLVAVLERQEPVIGRVRIPDQDPTYYADLFASMQVLLYDPQGCLVAVTNLQSDGSYSFDKPMVSQNGVYVTAVVSADRPDEHLLTEEVNLLVFG